MIKTKAAESGNYFCKECQNDTIDYCDRCLEKIELDEVIYCEDMDICYRAWHRGWRTIYEPHAVTCHLGQATTKKHLKKDIDFQVYRTKNFLLLTWKNLFDERLLRKHLLWIFFHFLKAIIKGDQVYPKAMTKACFQLKEVLSARRRERKALVVEDRVIFSRLNTCYWKDNNVVSLP